MRIEERVRLSAVKGTAGAVGVLSNGLARRWRLGELWLTPLFVELLCCQLHAVSFAFAGTYKCIIKYGISGNMILFP
jgi:hypothetical protein